jgi:hypothetical protein
MRNKEFIMEHLQVKLEDLEVHRKNQTSKLVVGTISEFAQYRPILKTVLGLSFRNGTFQNRVEEASSLFDHKIFSSFL